MPALTFDLYARGEQRVTNAFRSIRMEADKTERATKGMHKAWSGLSTVGGLAGKAAIGLGLGIAGAGAAVVAMTDDVVGLNLQVGKARTVFGASFAAVDRSLSKTASAFGITRIEALGLAATFADQARQAGFATKQAADMSLRFVDLAGRVKLLSAGVFDSAEASEALSAAFRGEFDSLQRVVPAISAAKVEQVALDLQKKSSKKLTDAQAQSLAVLKIVQDGTKTSSALMATAEGRKALAIDKARTSMREAWQEIQINLLPAFTALWESVSGQVTPALRDFSAYLQSPEGQKAVKQWTATIADAIGTVGKLIGSLDDLQLTMNQLSLEARIAWLKVGLAVQDTKATFDDAIASIPGMGDGWKQAAKDAHAAADRIQRDIDGLDTQASQLEVQRLQRKIDALHGKTVDAKTSPAAKARALREIRDLQQHIDRLQGKTVGIGAKVIFPKDWQQYRAGERMAGGGPVGRGRGYVDEVPVLAMRGEHMLTTKDVDALGGHAGVFAFRQALHNGGLRRMAAGGPVDPSGTPTSAARLTGAIDDALERFAVKFGQYLQKRLDLLGAGYVRGWAAQWAVLHRAFPNAQLFSAYRPGAITSSGNLSYHALGRAIDVTPSMAIFNWIAARYGRNSKELIYTPAGYRQIKNGRSHLYTGQVARDHENHVHWAAADGGVLREPVLGVGQRSGASYSLAERGPERVLSATQTKSFDRLVRAMDYGRMVPAASAARPVVYETHVHIDGVVAGGERQVVELVSKAVKSARQSGHLHTADFK